MQLEVELSNLLQAVHCVALLFVTFETDQAYVLQKCNNLRQVVLFLHYKICALFLHDKICGVTDTVVVLHEVHCVQYVAL